MPRCGQMSRSAKTPPSVPRQNSSGSPSSVLPPMRPPREAPPARGRRRGWLAGLPLAIKDSMDVAGVRSTHGSPIFADHVPGRSDLQVEALERNGGVVLARSNAPEFAAGANTFNEVFGRTLNPWNTAMSCGGSSGGSAGGPPPRQGGVPHCHPPRRPPPDPPPLLPRGGLAAP